MVDVFHFTCHFYYKSPPQKFKLDLYGYEVPEEASKLLTKRVARSRLSLGRRSCRYFSSLACPCVCRKWLSFKCLSYDSHTTMIISCIFKLFLIEGMQIVRLMKKFLL